ncbi:MAG: preprotein translocase subunit SecA [Candidatus Omnitrophica bacterium CG11_big_fil_rev_8_21_14_0_20_45_26]|uniref:Protein translocase subunit SecA n=1 Tax=Candidatus Abzuiibacterium crystallinum TaxID=1974748 RepID=A0A2H0LL50_9BACT|nr:MAG: preprotein translocase subunit SecA [Candidatus Omnitrophica bacterium CG11_big_fil_rev_8_21_14_0_20_45_26]PIW63789.1 MAG: preprotein translocase subunit SecA [Candidatus Omnitrophica bacterium CG12_big_fil_rev_8_21_14_0_65_45_16]
MISTLIRKIFPSRNTRILAKHWPAVHKINALESAMQAFSDEALRAKTNEFKGRLEKGETPDQLLVEAFAVVREAARRTIKMRHYDVQLLGGIALHQGNIAEMSTGEGKTLVATLPVYLNALAGKGVHLVTVNDYLAKRDREWMGPIYEFLGLTVGVIQHDMPHTERQAAYRSDVTYGTNNEFGFDYLRDNMVSDLDDRVQRPLYYAIVDEVDSILVDEARTPLIISGPAEESTDKYYQINRVIPHLKETTHYEKDEKANTVALTEEGITKCEALLGVENLYENTQIDLIHHINQGLKAHVLFQRDVDYMIKDGKVVIVDEFTGRLMPGRRFSDGLHQALEAKENVKIERENQTLATVTFQNYFRMYKKLAGMTGTAATEAVEFDKIYKLDVVVMPTNRPCVREDLADSVYKTEREKFNAVVDHIQALHSEGRPVLVGTISIEKSEHLSQLLNRRQLAHTVLNAKYHEQEAEIISRAGQTGAITIATNMAGRGTDIVLGEGVAAKGGLHVLGTERHESRRIDNQLRGRCARQGDPGSSKFYLSLEDDLMRIFGSDRIKMLMDRMGMEEGQEIESGLVSKAIETAQKRVESHNFEIRKHLLDFDDVMNRQREIVYQERDEILNSKDLSKHVLEMADNVLEDLILEFLGPEIPEEDRDEKKLFEAIQRKFNISLDQLETGSGQGMVSEQEILHQEIMDRVRAAYEKKRESFGRDQMLFLERYILLQLIDAKWKEHLHSIDNLREGIHLRAYAQSNPLVEYKREAFALFDEMVRNIRQDTIGYLFRIQSVKQEKVHTAMDTAQQKLLHPESSGFAAGPAPPLPQPSAQQPSLLRPSLGGQVPIQKTGQTTQPKVGRNDPCPCGSGKKYKKCHGAV